jgi:hypothetical protein
MNVIGVAGVFSRRYATDIRRNREPWVETHGYHHEVAPRHSLSMSAVEIEGRFSN